MDELLNVMIFVLYGNLLGKKTELSVKEWREIINFILNLFDDAFDDIYRFTPIKSLVISKADTTIVGISKDLNFETPCHKLIALVKHRQKNGITFEESDTLFITPQKKWVVWHRERGIKMDSTKVICEVSKFKKVKNIRQFLEKGNALKIISNLHLWLQSSNAKKEDELSKGRRIEASLYEIYTRAKQVT